MRGGGLGLGVEFVLFVFRCLLFLFFYFFFFWGGGGGALFFAVLVGFFFLFLDGLASWGLSGVAVFVFCVWGLELRKGFRV